MNMWEYMSQNPGMTLILLLGVCYITKYVVRGVIISIHGWPPSHLDADGDFKENT